MNADVLSDVLSAIRLTGAAYFDFNVSSPWVAEAPAASEIASIVMPGAQRVIEYHLMAEGSCWGNMIGGEPIRLREGDLLVFPQGDPHVLASAPGMRAAPNMAAYHRDTPLPLCYEMGGGGPDRARIVCGFLGCDERPFNPLLAALPRVMHIAASDDPTTVGWLGMMLKIAARESNASRPGGENLLARMSELLFVEAVRRHVESLSSSHTGWLAGLRDPVVGEALSAFHAEPAAQWTVEQLARRIGVSRSVLAERFSTLVGQPPMQYLTLWRMQLASRRLTDGEQVSAVAGAVGYESEAAFSRAFKKVVGQAPGTWRRPATRAAPATAAPAD